MLFPSEVVRPAHDKYEGTQCCHLRKTDAETGKSGKILMDSILRSDERNFSLLFLLLTHDLKVFESYVARVMGTPHSDVWCLYSWILHHRKISSWIRAGDDYWRNRSSWKCSDYHIWHLVLKAYSRDPVKRISNSLISKTKNIFSGIWMLYGWHSDDGKLHEE